MQKFEPLQLVIYLTAFLILAPLTITISFISLVSISTQKAEKIDESGQNLSTRNLLEAPRFGAQVYAALPQSQSTVLGEATSADARFEIIRQYLANYKSPLEPFSDLIVAVSDQYGLDWRLLTAIAQQESNLCKKAPEGSYNCWGWGIHSRGTLGFSSYPEAIQEVAQGIREEYIDKGYDSVEELMEKYTPLSNGSWAAGVNQFLLEME